MKVICIIPARGGSKRIPNKNLIRLGGHPIIEWTIHDAKASTYDMDVVVSTDDKNIKQTALEHGAEVVDRPEYLASDVASSESAIVHVLDEKGWDYEYVVFLQCTTPFRDPHQIDNGIDFIVERGADSLLFGCKTMDFMWEKIGDTAVPLNYDISNRIREQDRNPYYIESGDFIFKPWVLQRHNNRLGGKIAIYGIDEKYRCQIDEPDDILFAEALIDTYGFTVET